MSKNSSVLQNEEGERFARLWTQSQPGIARYIRSLVPDYHIAEDILQDVAVVCFRKMSQYDPKRPFLAWGLGIARRRVLNHWRRSARKGLIAYPDVVETLAEVHDEISEELGFRMRALEDCMSALGRKARRLLDLRYQSKLPIANIADSVEATTNSVKVMLSRIRLGLRHCITKKLAARAV